jgi:hypothetical protein
MPFTSWRGTLGPDQTHPPAGLVGGDDPSAARRHRGGAGDDRVQAGTTREFEDGLPAIEAKVRELADIGVDLIGPGGGPP